MPSLEQLLGLLAAEPDDSFLRYAVGMEYARQSRHAEALREFAETLRRDPDYVPAYAMGGRSARQLGDLKESRRLYDEGIAVARRKGQHHAADDMAEALATLP